jgi:hypothetical protein
VIDRIPWQTERQQAGYAASVSFLTHLVSASVPMHDPICWIHLRVDHGVSLRLSIFVRLLHILQTACWLANQQGGLCFRVSAMLPASARAPGAASVVVSFPAVANEAAAACASATVNVIAAFPAVANEAAAACASAVANVIAAFPAVANEVTAACAPRAAGVDAVLAADRGAAEGGAVMVREFGSSWLHWRGAAMSQKNSRIRKKAENYLKV